MHEMIYRVIIAVIVEISFKVSGERLKGETE